MSIAPDVRGFYVALGVELPQSAQVNAPVRCFAAPAAHNHGDRSPSCSVNLTSGAWNCHGCGAHGGAYDAALAVGHTPRSAIDLMVAHSLTAHRAGSGSTRDRSATAKPTARSRPRVESQLPALQADDADVQRWAERLDGDSRLFWRLMRERAWSGRVIRQLQIGFDGARITIPVRTSSGTLRGVLRYEPFRRHGPKMLAVPGTTLGLMPHPARELSRHVILVEGPPDMIAARSSGLPAIAVPGTHAWQPEWAELLRGRRVTIVMDCDEPGRAAAERIRADLHPVASTVDVADLWPGRSDGYDLSDRILESRRVTTRFSRPGRETPALLAPRAGQPQQIGRRG
jgi:hypothetical protein